MFSKLNIIYGVLSVVFGFFSIYSLCQLDTNLISFSIPIFVFSITNSIVFSKLDDMQKDMKNMKNDYTTDIKKLNNEIEKIKEKIKDDDD